MPNTNYHMQYTNVVRDNEREEGKSYLRCLFSSNSNEFISFVSKGHFVDSIKFIRFEIRKIILYYRVYIIYVNILDPGTVPADMMVNCN